MALCASRCAKRSMGSRSTADTDVWLCRSSSTRFSTAAASDSCRSQKPRASFPDSLVAARRCAMQRPCRVASTTHSAKAESMLGPLWAITWDRKPTRRRWLFWKLVSGAGRRVQTCSRKIQLARQTVRAASTAHGAG